MTELPTPACVESRDVTVLGVRTRLYEVDPHTDRAPLIVLHGAGADSALVSYGGILSDLGSSRRVIAPDLPGYGDTDYPADASFGVDWYAEFVVALCRTLNLDQVGLGGLSLGGFISLQTALDYPDVVYRLILVNPGGITDKYKNMKLARSSLITPASTISASKLLSPWAAASPDAVSCAS
jgi:pimeloyl-ACP methyl ester carboxylesterase